jgi:hypothetical protein
VEENDEKNANEEKEEANDPDGGSVAAFLVEQFEGSPVEPEGTDFDSGPPVR